MNTAAGETDQAIAAGGAAAEQSIGNVRTVATAAEELSISVTRSVSRSTPPPRSRPARFPRPAPPPRYGAWPGQRSRAYGEVIGLINAIASQTNLLALNANHRGGARRCRRGTAWLRRR